MGVFLNWARRAIAAVTEEDAIEFLIEQEEAALARRVLREPRNGGVRRISTCPSCRLIVKNPARPCPHCDYHNGWHPL